MSVIQCPVGPALAQVQPHLSPGMTEVIQTSVQRSPPLETSPYPPGWPGPLPRAPTEPECPSLSPSDSACASPITAPTALGCCCLSTAVYASGVGAPLDRARDIVSHCCVPSIAQGKVWSRVPPTHSLAVWPWARPLTSVPQCLICERGKKVAQATPQLPAELGRVWARLTLTFPRDGVTQGSGTAAVTTRAPG